MKYRVVNSQCRILYELLIAHQPLPPRPPPLQPLAGRCTRDQCTHWICANVKTAGQYGVGFVINRVIKNNIDSFIGISERLAILNIDIGGQSPTGKRSRGRPPTRWEDDLRQIAGPNWTDIARDRDVRASLEEAFTQSGPYALYKRPSWKTGRERQNEKETCAFFVVAQCATGQCGRSGGLGRKFKL
ncbi:hypothetical protein EVAR_52924_1 [Eumeta japonica]|uniref:Uncharacterized protein n=1 Tax=Eumeta variegata TaxID=151549 RepID=A0A4C1Y8C9_EUMVA|nr:hypothetical protein EVAR_52924_1 [Eumeta japonica]